MPPTGVWISTCLSSPFCSFFTFTLQAERRSSAPMENANKNAGRNPNLVLRMARFSFDNLPLTLKAGAAVRDIGNRDRQMAANWNLPKQCFDRGHFRHRRIRKCANVIFGVGE